ncbi:MAG TPA: hypothetical protein VJT69_00195 [Pyrinomonadaceae bacterium]|nr:hypothetical protein [Pyrinomonadaceae bacterium]
MSKKIQITASGGKDASDFTDCYFLPTNVSGSYILMGKNHDPIVTNPIPVTNGTNFSFSLSGFTWNITSFAINNEDASGNWTNTDPTLTNTENGTFTAQATGVVPEEESASAANA